ncbi:FAD-dependent monooxygenase [Mycobacterium sp. WMMD1722]|uniref:FAD-dependent monooxygenase n=1 Tax=Mycobacterium sp. WMMD1722 TaxID=3404117 RepID=UPI003BF541B7
MSTALKVLVCGSSIAGPAAAYWLLRNGHDVTIIERSPVLRGAGQNIDVRGSGREVLRRMNLERKVKSHSTGEIGTRFVDDEDRTLWQIPAGDSDSGGTTANVEILRGELSRLLVDALPDDTVIHLGRHITDVDQDDGGVTVTFNDGERARYDLIVIAEGTRSSTRRIVFGDVPTQSLGLYTAFATIPRAEDDDLYWNWYNGTGGRSITVRPDNKGTTRIALSFLSPPMGYENMPGDQQKTVLIEKFGDLGWKTPRILQGVAGTDELYIDYLTQVCARTYSAGRVVLLGDAAWCATPVSGLGATLALTGAYVLAGVLAGGDTVDAALCNYQERMSVFVDGAHKLPPGGPRLLHPRTRVGLSTLRTLMRVAGSPPARALAALIPSRPSPTTDLPHYPDSGV